MQKSLSTLRQILLSAIPVLLLILTAVSVFAIYSTEQPYEEADASSAAPSKECAEVANDPSAETAVAASTGVRRKGVQNFLVCGKDRASGLYDVIIVAQLDTANRSASLVQIPRDTYAAYTEKSYRKLNGAASALGGIKEMSDFLSETLGVPIDHYALVDLDCIGDIVDAIGGVTLTVPSDMDYEDKSQNLSIHLKAGRQTLNGDLAESFLRYRSGYVTADLGRLDAQKLFLAAFLGEIKAHSTLPELIRIVRTLYGRVETDLSLGDCVRLASAGLKLSPERLSMTTLPGEAARTGETQGAWYYILCREAAYDTVNRMLNVSDTPIAPSAFDPKERFTSGAYPHFEAIYHSTRTAGKTVNGDHASDHYGSVPRTAAG